MAVTKIKPIRSTINKSIDYVCNAKKTEECKYIYSERCFPQTAAAEFEIYLRNAQAGNTIGRHLIQSFAPGETTPEQAHEIGRKLAAEILGGQYAYVMSTHVDRNHIHNHFVWCSVNLETNKKYRSNKATYHKIQEVSDRLCGEYNLSVITEKSGLRGKSYTEYQADKNNNSWKHQLRKTIDAAIRSANDFEAFLKFMREADYEIKYGKYISFCARNAGQERFTRGKTIGDDYTEERIRARIQSKEPLIIAPPSSDFNVRQVIDIEGSEKIKSNPGYEHWARIFNLKESARTLIYLKENNMADVDKFNACYKISANNFFSKKDVFIDSQKRIKELQELQTKIRQYANTKEVYKAYMEAKDKNKFLRKNDGAERDIALHKASKKHFNDYTAKYGKPLPKIAEVTAEIQSLKSSLPQQEADYKAAKTEFDNMVKLKVNLQHLLGKDSVKEYSYER